MRICTITAAIAGVIAVILQIVFQISIGRW